MGNSPAHGPQCPAPSPVAASGRSYAFPAPAMPPSRRSGRWPRWEIARTWTVVCDALACRGQRPLLPVVHAKFPPNHAPVGAAHGRDSRAPARFWGTESGFQQVSELRNWDGLAWRGTFEREKGSQCMRAEGLPTGSHSRSRVWTRSRKVSAFCSFMLISTRWASSTFSRAAHSSGVLHFRGLGSAP
ncbi:hypothetical protein SAMN05216212_0651 [Microbulbifer yueqingensis]|uniref:Uncharacterized protein n=1 Tax=Microbulbifer yueqingensis TaxID=658219 RepID=A0A1G8VNF4_9GAMM|nr:hypothetical protein SAMN05216212_0651 [Microbulbifer yueqingensis]